MQICKVLNICADRVDEQALYVEPLCRLLELCGLCFLKEKTSDEVTYRQIAVESVSQIGKFLESICEPKLYMNLLSTMAS